MKIQNNNYSLKNVTDICNKVVVKMNSKLLSQIQFMHNKEKNCEWSGTLIYKFAEDIKIEDLFKTTKEDRTIDIEAFKFLLHDVGTSGGTEFDLSEEEIMEKMNYVVEGYRTGLIHTHHDMDTYFSATDNNELLTNTPNYDMYLSLITNFKNGGEPIARLCWKGEVQNSFSYYVGNLLKSVKLANSKKVIYFIDVEIKFDIDEDIIKKLNKIKENKLNFRNQFYGGYTNIGEYYGSNNSNNINDDQLNFNFERSLNDKKSLNRFYTLDNIKKEDALGIYDEKSLVITLANLDDVFRTTEAVNKFKCRKLDNKQVELFLFELLKENKKFNSFDSIVNAYRNIDVSLQDDIEELLRTNFESTIESEFNINYSDIEIEQLYLISKIQNYLKNKKYKDNNFVKIILNSFYDISIELSEEFIYINISN